MVGYGHVIGRSLEDLMLSYLKLVGSLIILFSSTIFLLSSNHKARVSLIFILLRLGILVSFFGQ